jgi:hypothetical protein
MGRLARGEWRDEWHEPRSTPELDLETPHGRGKLQAKKSAAG